MHDPLLAIVSPLSPLFISGISPTSSLLPRSQLRRALWFSRRTQTGVTQYTGAEAEAAGAGAIPQGSPVAPCARHDGEASARLGGWSARPPLIWERRDQRATCSSRVRGTSRETGQCAPCRRRRAARIAVAAAAGRRSWQKLRRASLAERVAMQAMGTCRNRRAGRHRAAMQNSRKRAVGSAGRAFPALKAQYHNVRGAGGGARSSAGNSKAAACGRAGLGSAPRSAIAARCREFIREREERRGAGEGCAGAVAIAAERELERERSCAFVSLCKCKCTVQVQVQMQVHSVARVGCGSVAS